jgi:hypothetical protein
MIRYHISANPHAEPLPIIHYSLLKGGFLVFHVRTGGTLSITLSLLQCFETSISIRCLPTHRCSIPVAR